MTQFEVAGVKQGLAVRFDPAHRAAQNVAGGQQGDLPIGAAAFKSGRLSEGQNVFLPRATDPCSQELRRRRGQNHFAMFANMIAVGMADEDLFRAGLRLMRIEPKREFRKINPATIVMERQRRHRNNLSIVPHFGGARLLTSTLERMFDPAKCKLYYPQLIAADSSVETATLAKAS